MRCHRPAQPPDFIPLLGLLDHALLIPPDIWLFARLVSAELLAEYRATAKPASSRPVGK